VLMRLLMLGFSIAMVTLGGVSLVLPRSVQVIATKAVEVGRAPQLVRTFVQSNAYLWNVRAVGVLALTGGWFLAYVLLRSQV